MGKLKWTLVKPKPPRERFYSDNEWLEIVKKSRKNERRCRGKKGPDSLGAGANRRLAQSTLTVPENGRNALCFENL